MRTGREQVVGAFEKITVSVPSEVAAALRQSARGEHDRADDEIVWDVLVDWVRASADETQKTAWLRETLAKADEGPWSSEDDAFARVEAAIAQHDWA